MVYTKKQVCSMLNPVHKEAVFPISSTFRLFPVFEPRGRKKVQQKGQQRAITCLKVQYFSIIHMHLDLIPGCTSGVAL